MTQFNHFQASIQSIFIQITNVLTMIKAILLLFFFIFLTLQGFSDTLNQTPLAGYILPKSKQGITSRNYDIKSKKRYEIFENELTLGLQKFDYYWANAEDGTTSSNILSTCEKGYFLFPENKYQKNALGIHHYHCYKKSFSKKWNKILTTNASHHMQAALVLWTTPEQYRNQGCEGFYFGKQKRHLTEGCYPEPKHYNDYVDWVKFTAHRFGEYVDHYIVWNEIDSTNWADSSTIKFPKKLMAKNLKFHMERSFKIYTTLLKETINAVNSLDNICLDFTGDCKNLVYVSLTGDWYSRTPSVHKNKKGATHIRWRNINLLDYIWKELGIVYDWAIAIHPYGNVYGKSETSISFSTLTDLSSYQKAQIDSRKSKGRSWLSYPHSRLYASEQNVGHKIKPDNWKLKAKYICESYDVAVHMPEIIAITHNHFQDNKHRKNAKPTQHTMLPSSVSEDLSDANRYETFHAYRSTALHTWGKINDHYCCEQHKLGCRN